MNADYSESELLSFLEYLTAKNLINPSTAVLRRGNLKDHQQGHHARDDAQHGRARAQCFRVQHHRAAQHNLEGQRVEHGEHKHVAQPGGKHFLWSRRFHRARTMASFASQRNQSFPVAGTVVLPSRRPHAA